MKRLTFLFLFSVAAFSELEGKTTVQWPKKTPSFAITFPDGWRCEAEDDGGLRCNAEDKSGLHVNFTSTVWKTEQDAKAGIAEFAEGMAKSSEFKNVEQGEVRETMSSAKVKLSRLETMAVMGKTSVVIWAAIFKTGNNPYIILSGAMARGNAEHAKRIDEIVSSIAPIAGDEHEERKTGDLRPYKGSLMTLLGMSF